MSSFLDMMLRPEAPAVKDKLPTTEYEIKRLSAALGSPVTLTLHALSYGKAQELRQLERDQDVEILLAGCPELKDKALADKFGGAVPAETVKNMLLPGEIADLSRAVEKLTGYRQATIEEVKNA